MGKPTTSSAAGGGEILCVGRLEITRPKPLGLLCVGSLPVSTDQSFRDFNSALVSSSQTVSAPRYRVLPMETDLNTPPPSGTDRVLPVDDHGVVRCAETDGDVPWDNSATTSNLARRGEALAVSGLLEYGDDMDVIAPADILKQIFKMPYSKAKLSIAVHRIGNTLVLNPGPGIEEGERSVRRNHTKCADHSLFLNFAMHSVRMEACDCPPSHSASKSQAKSSMLPDSPKFHESSFTSSDIQTKTNAANDEVCGQNMDNSDVKQQSFYWDGTKNRSKRQSPVKKVSQVDGKPKCSVRESDKYRRGGSDEFLRVLIWQFHNFRMLLGSDLLLVSNEKYLAVSLHLWDISRQVTPLNWLEAWLDNVMASVPELAICYHLNGVVQGYELLKTDDIFLMKGISEDGTPAFHPYVVQQNGLSVLRFLQENCKQDPGAYWLYKCAGEDVIQLFDLSVIPVSHQSDSYDNCASSLPSFIYRGRTDALSSLGKLLYRVAHRLALSMAPGSRARCSDFFRKCFELLEEPDHMVIRALAHEQFARLILNNDAELDLTLQASSLMFEAKAASTANESLDSLSSISNLDVHGPPSPANGSLVQDGKENLGLFSESIERNLVMESSKVRTLIPTSPTIKSSSGDAPLSQGDAASAPVTETISDPVASKLAAVHHVSQAIKSLRWTRQLQETDPEIRDDDGSEPNSSMSFSLCACGDTECIEVCDIKQWLPTVKLDQKLWKLILLLGESYLALGEAYREDDQLLQALKVVEIACSVYGSMPQHLENTKFISSMVSIPFSQTLLNVRRKKAQSIVHDKIRVQTSACDFDAHDGFSSLYLFWFKAWTLVGDLYVEFYKRQGLDISTNSHQDASGGELKISSEVVEELMRLKNILVKENESCNTCSLVNCSCQSNRVSSGDSASSSSADDHSLTHGSRRQGRRPSTKNAMTSHSPNIHNEARKEAANLRQESSGSSNSTALKNSDDSLENQGVTSQKALKTRSGGIFKYLRGPITDDMDSILSSSLSCYEQARKALGDMHEDSEDLQAVIKKVGWVCNELGRYRLEKKNLAEAEIAFADAIKAFREVSDITNVILINCNLGHGRRALAEKVVSELEYLKLGGVLHNAYRKALEAAKKDYASSLGFYHAAKSEIVGGVDISAVVRNEVYTQLAHTYLRLGMLLSRDVTVAEIYDYGALEERKMEFHGSDDKKTKKKLGKQDISANDAIMKSVSLYESLGELREQEAAYAYLQLASHQRDCCLELIDSDNKSGNTSRNDNSSLRWSKQLAERYRQKAIEARLFAENNWLRALEFYKADTHPVMYLTILIERSTLSLHLSSCMPSNSMLESALTCLLDGRMASSHSKSIQSSNPEIYTKFWSLLQKVLLKILQFSTASASASSINLASKRSVAADKVKELYKTSLKSTGFNQLHTMYDLWSSQSL
ncbi:hypothetical protein Droror1_Dr00004790 [Drosera rotundifolia]